MREDRRLKSGTKRAQTITVWHLFSRLKAKSRGDNAAGGLRGESQGRGSVRYLCTGASGGSRSRRRDSATWARRGAGIPAGSCSRTSSRGCSRSCSGPRRAAGRGRARRTPQSRRGHCCTLMRGGGNGRRSSSSSSERRIAAAAAAAAVVGKKERRNAIVHARFSCKKFVACKIMERLREQFRSLLSIVTTNKVLF